MRAFIKNAEIERRAEDVIASYERKGFPIVKPPVPIEQILMQVYGLHIDWDVLSEAVLGGLDPTRKTIVLNSVYREMFASKPGLERSTIGHEAGHWEYDIDKAAIDQPTLFDPAPEKLYLGIQGRKYGAISTFRDNILGDRIVDSEGVELISLDSSDQRRVVNRFAAALSMPRHLVREVVREGDTLSWGGMYKISKTFDVSITALKVRLEQLGYNYYDGKEFHRNKAEAHGQHAMRF